MNNQLNLSKGKTQCENNDNHTALNVIVLNATFVFTSWTNTNHRNSKTQLPNPLPVRIIL